MCTFRRKKILKILITLVLILFVAKIIKAKFKFKKKQVNLEKSREKLFKVLKSSCDVAVFKTAVECSEGLITVNDSFIKDSCDECLYDKNDNELVVYYHTFWNVDSNVSQAIYEYKFRMLKLNLMSYLVTQNLCCSKLILWHLTGLSNQIKSKLTAIFGFYFKNKIIEFKLFDIKDLCFNSISFKDHSICKLRNKEIKTKDMVSLSDFVRFFVLDQLGGIYTDADVIYLRNMNLLWMINFAYLWGNTKDTLNTAILSINKNLNPSINELYSILLRNKTNLNQLIKAFHPYSVSKEVYKLSKRKFYGYKGLYVLRSYLFDPPWLCFEKRQRPLDKHVCKLKEFTEKVFIEPDEFKFEKFFPGAFTYHIHGDCGPFVNNKSYFNYLETYFKLKLNLELDNRE